MHKYFGKIVRPESGFGRNVSSLFPSSCLGLVGEAGISQLQTALHISSQIFIYIYFCKHCQLIKINSHVNCHFLISVLKLPFFPGFSADFGLFTIRVGKMYRFLIMNFVLKNRSSFSIDFFLKEYLNIYFCKNFFHRKIDTVHDD
jgi:hypothetical protein